LGHHIAAFPVFSVWSFSPKVLYAFIISMLLMYWGKSRQLEMVANAGLNLQVISSMLLMIQGISVAFFYSAKYEVPKILRWIFVTIAFTNGFIMQATVFAGAFDVAMDFRKLRRSLPQPKNTDMGE